MWDTLSAYSMQFAFLLLFSFYFFFPVAKLESVVASYKPAGEVCSTNSDNN